MPYKDKDKQRAADRERARRYRLKRKGVTDTGCDAEGVTPDVIPEQQSHSPMKVGYVPPGRTP